MTTGFILTRQRKEYRGKTFLEFWLVSHQGPIKLTTSQQRDVFFIRQEDIKSIQRCLNQKLIQYEIKSLALKTFKHESVAAIYFDTVSACYKAQQELDKHNLACFESDIRLTERYLMERFINGGVLFTGHPVPVPLASPPSTPLKSNTHNTQNNTHNQAHFLDYTHAQLKPANYQPHFNVLSIDIECSEKGELYSIGLAAKNYQCVLMIGSKQSNSPSWLTWTADEKDLLHHFIDHIKAYDPDIIIGWNVINFDFRLLIKRAERHNIPLTIGRADENIRWRNARGEVNQGYVSMTGRIVIDGIDALKTATYHFSSFSLENVSRELLGKGKLSEDPDDRMAQINYDFTHNKVKLAKYNLQDCTLVLDIFTKTNIINFLTLRSQLTGLEIDRLGGSVAAFTNLYLPKLHRAGYISPNRPKDGGLASPGGYVMDSKPGLYQHVLVLDFKSLYPSIIRTFKVDPMGLIEGLQSPQDSIPGFKGALFSRDKHFLPGIITSLWAQRDEAKKNNDAARSQAIKILMNSFYGVLGSGGCPFYDTRLASSITLRGHSIMQTTAQWIKQAGYKVIYGDTDSTFVWLDNDEYSNDQACEIGKKLQKSINKKWQQKISQEFKLDNHLEIEFETHFTHFFMPTIRGSEVGSKKRYAGIQESKNGQELVFKGLETVRSDWTELAKSFQHQLYSKVFAQQDVKDYIQQQLHDTRMGIYDDKLVYRKRLRKHLNQYIKNIPPQVKAARQADAINLANGKNLRYQNKGWVSYVMTKSGPQAIEHVNCAMDYEHYIEKQIRPIADAILPFIGLSFDNITQAQLNLFS